MMRGMMPLLAGVAMLGAVAATPAMAAGCLKGAAVGGVAGHVAGHHAVLGAAAGCAIGHHEASKAAKARAAQQTGPVPGQNGPTQQP